MGMFEDVGVCYREQGVLCTDGECGHCLYILNRLQFVFNREMMETALRANGWTNGWAGDDWVSQSMNADRGGMELKEAFEAMLYGKNLIGKDVKNCWKTA